MQNKSKPIVIALPAAGFDPSEAAITWRVLKDAAQSVVFATPDGQPAKADPLMVTGEGLDWWGRVPLLKKLKLVGLMLRANQDARRAYRQMLDDSAFRQPITYADINPNEIDGLILPGGHDKAIRPFLENPILQDRVRVSLTMRSLGGHLPVAAICHGVLVLARTSGDNGKSIIHNRQVTALPWDFERKAWQLSKIFRYWDPDYYRTYREAPEEPLGYWSVEAEIKRLLYSPEQFCVPTPSSPNYKLNNSALHRDSLVDSRPAWVVKDGNLVTARWPGDAHLFAGTVLSTVEAFREKNRQAEVLDNEQAASSI